MGCDEEVKNYSQLDRLASVMQNCDLTELETRNKVQLSVGNRGLVILTINLYPVVGEYRADGASNDATLCTSNMSTILYILRDIT